MFYYTLFSSVLWMVVVMTCALLEPNGTITVCHLKLQNNIDITETICPAFYNGCIIRPTPSSEDITALPGTKIRYKCINSFPEEESSTDITTTCEGQRWVPQTPRCEQVITMPQSNQDWSNRTLWKSPIFPSKCGISTIQTNVYTPSVWSGNTVKVGEFPWHAGVYSKTGENTQKPICGATIIASQYLLSAAHCFTEITNTARIRNHTEFYIMVGKLKSRNDVTEDYQQRHEIKRIFTNAYRGRDFRYQNDIAIIRTRSEIPFNSNVSPICMINDYFPHISENTDLWVAGWGYFNVSPIQSEDLMSIKLPYMSYEECSNNRNYEQASTFLTTEKFCTVRNASMRMSLDKGDSGGGLVTKGPNNTYYLIGIVSLSQDGSPIAMCTNVPQFHKWIFETTLNYHIHLRDMAIKPRNTECGISTIKGDVKPLFPIANKVKLGEFPWHAGVYESKGEKSRKPICGATIIASRYLLSAAHCFAEETNKAEMRDPTAFYITVGKLQSRNDLTERYQQRHDITHIITKAYRGIEFRYRNDVAVIKTKSKITFNSNVSPICMINDYFPHIQENTGLWAAGWGFFNSSEIQSENLMSVNLPYISYKECSGYTDSAVSHFLTTEKFCTLKSSLIEMSLDKGDPGGGLVTKGPNNAYYLIGIVSASREDSAIVICTYVSVYHQWIIETTSDDYIHSLDKNSPRNGTMTTKPRNTVCGQPSQTTKTPPTTGTYPVLPGEFPWHAGVYQKSFNNTLICGATIISSYTLLSAAHCFHDPINDRQRSPLDYEIRVGEITRDTFTEDSETTAIYQVESLIFNRFQGTRLPYARDIVIIVTKTEISFNSQVSPICMFQDSSFTLPSNQLSHVVRWNSQKNVSEVVNQPYISFEDCYKLIPPSELAHLQSEKFCSSTNKTASDWEGRYDGGSGLVWKNPVDFTYYLVGIELEKVKNSSIVLNTDVSTYLPWIREKLDQIHKAKNEIFSG